jgi:hypothetical protein
MVYELIVVVQTLRLPRCRDYQSDDLRLHVDLSVRENPHTIQYRLDSVEWRYQSIVSLNKARERVGSSELSGLEVSRF